MDIDEIRALRRRVASLLDDLTPAAIVHRAGLLALSRGDSDHLTACGLVLPLVTPDGFVQVDFRDGEVTCPACRLW